MNKINIKYKLFIAEKKVDMKIIYWYCNEECNILLIKIVFCDRKEIYYPVGIFIIPINEGYIWAFFNIEFTIFFLYHDFVCWKIVLLIVNYNFH